MMEGGFTQDFSKVLSRISSELQLPPDFEY